MGTGIRAWIGCGGRRCGAGSGNGRRAPALATAATSKPRPTSKKAATPSPDGQSGELRQRYYEGMEVQLGALGFVLNALVLCTTRYLDAAITELRGAGYEVRDADAARLSPLVRHHVNMLGRYSFLTPELTGGLRPLRDPSAPDEDEGEV